MAKSSNIEGIGNPVLTIGNVVSYVVLVNILDRNARGGV